jgi:hypothetical protein
MARPAESPAWQGRGATADQRPMIASGATADQRPTIASRATRGSAADDRQPCDPRISGR